MEKNPDIQHLDTRSVNNQIPEAFRRKEVASSRRKSIQRLHRTKAQRRQGAVVTSLVATTVLTSLGSVELAKRLTDKDFEPLSVSRKAVVRMLKDGELEAQGNKMLLHPREGDTLEGVVEEITGQKDADRENDLLAEYSDDRGASNLDPATPVDITEYFDWDGLGQS